MAITGTYQTNDAVSYKDARVEVELTGANTVWAPISSWSTEVQVSGEDVPTTETYPFESNVIVFAGNKGPVELRVTNVYTEGTDDAFYQIRARFEADPGGNFDVRFKPAGEANGALLFTSSGGKLLNCLPPVGAGDASSPTLFTFVVRADALTMSVVTPSP